MYHVAVYADPAKYLSSKSFLPTVKEIARAVSAWRPVAPSMDALAIDGFHFIDGMVTKHLGSA
jgi:hypothetical protein